MLKLQKAVRSKRFDLIKHVLKQFARIREAGINGGVEESNSRSSPAPGVKSVSPAKPGDRQQEKQAGRGSPADSVSSDNYDQPEDLIKQSSQEQLHPMLSKTSRVKAMTSSQIIAEKTMKLNPVEEKNRLQR